MKKINSQAYITRSVQSLEILFRHYEPPRLFRKASLPSDMESEQPTERQIQHVMKIIIRSSCCVEILRYHFRRLCQFSLTAFVPLLVGTDNLAGIKSFHHHRWFSVFMKTFTVAAEGAAYHYSPLWQVSEARQTSHNFFRLRVVPEHRSQRCYKSSALLSFVL